jgi:hypothetical protein
MMLRTGLEWFKLLVVCLIAILAWQVSLGADEPVAVPKAELRLLTTTLSADTADPVIEQGYPGSNELFDGDVGSDDCAHYAIQMLQSQGTVFVVSPACMRTPSSLSRRDSSRRALKARRVFS